MQSVLYKLGLCMALLLTQLGWIGCQAGSWRSGWVLEVTTTLDNLSSWNSWSSFLCLLIDAFIEFKPECPRLGLSDVVS